VISVSVSRCVCVSIREFVAHGRGLVVLWRRCDNFCILSVLWMTSYLHILDHVEASRSMLLLRVTSLRRRAHVNAAAAVSHWLRRILDDGVRQD